MVTDFTCAHVILTSQAHKSFTEFCVNTDAKRAYGVAILPKCLNRTGYTTAGSFYFAHYTASNAFHAALDTTFYTSCSSCSYHKSALSKRNEN